MTRSRAIVAIPHGGMPEMLSGTKCVVADPAISHFPEAVAGFLADPEKRQRAKASALEEARHDYDPQKISSDYIVILNAAA